MALMLPLFAPVTPVVAALGAGNILAVGGAVRAHLLQQSGAGVDIDLCTPLLPEEVIKRAQAAGLATDLKGLKWGCVVVAGIEVTTLRTEVYAMGSRYPQVAFTTDLATDAARRDFSVNAIYLAPDGTLHDFYKGLEHLQAAKVVWLGNPVQKLPQDPVRWWRWLRFCGRLGVAGLQAPAWAGVGGIEMPLTLTALAALAFNRQGAVSKARRATEIALINATPHAHAVSSLLRQQLAGYPDWVEELIP